MPMRIDSSSVRRPAITLLPCVAAGVMACLYLGSPSRAYADLSFDDKPSTPSPNGADGFTRENSTDLAPGTGKTAPPVGPPSTPMPEHAPVVAQTHVHRHARLEDNSKEGPKDFASNHHRETPAAAARVAARSSQPRRNPVESFVYYWNGFVMNTFHTRTGTVFLNKVGAKS